MEKMKEGMDSYAVLWTKRYMAMWNQGYESLPPNMAEEQAKVAACNTMMIAARDSGVLKVPKELLADPKDEEATKRLMERHERLKEIEAGAPKPKTEEPLDKRATDLKKEVAEAQAPAKPLVAENHTFKSDPVDLEDAEVKEATPVQEPVKEEKKAEPECKGIITHTKKNGKKKADQAQAPPSAPQGEGPKAEEKATAKAPERVQGAQEGVKPKAPVPKQAGLGGYPFEVPKGPDGNPLPAFDRTRPDGWNFCSQCGNQEINHEKQSGKGSYQACYECRLWLNANGKAVPMDK